MGEINRDPDFERVPFDIKEESSYGPNIQELKNNPDKLVRIEWNLENLDKAKMLKSIFEEMKNDYGVDVVDMDMAFGEVKKGQRNFFIVVDKVEGEDFYKIDEFSEAVKEKFEKFYIGILQSVLDAYKNKKSFFSDFHGNFMYGHKSKEKNTEDRFIIHDVGNFNAGFSDSVSEAKLYDQDFIDSIRLAYKDFLRYEEKFGHLDKIRQKLEEILQYLRDHKIEALEDLAERDDEFKFMLGANGVNGK